MKCNLFTRLIHIVDGLDWKLKLIDKEPYCKNNKSKNWEYHDTSPFLFDKLNKQLRYFI